MSTNRETNCKQTLNNYDTRGKQMSGFADTADNVNENSTFVT